MRCVSGLITIAGVLALAVAPVAGVVADTAFLYQLDKTRGSSTFTVVGVDLGSGEISFRAPPLAPPSARLLRQDNALAVWGYSFGENTAAPNTLEVHIFDLETLQEKARHRIEVRAPMLPMSVWPREPTESISDDGTQLAVLVNRENSPGLALYDLPSGTLVTSFDVPFRGSTFPRIAWTKDRAALVLIEGTTGTVWVHAAADGKLLSTSRLFQAALDPDIDRVPQFLVAQPVENRIRAISVSGDMAVRALDGSESVANETLVELWQGQRRIGTPYVSSDDTFLTIPITTVTETQSEQTDNLLVVELATPPRQRHIKAAVRAQEALVTRQGQEIVVVTPPGDLGVLDRNGSVLRSYKLAGELQLIGTVTKADAGVAPAVADPAAAAPAKSRLGSLLPMLAGALLILGVAVAVYRRRRPGKDKL